MKRYKIRFTAITEAPVGKERKKESIIPETKLKREITAELIITLLKLLNIRIDVIAGKITSPEMSRVPIILIPTTIVSAVKNAIIILYKLTFIPVALEKLSSKVTANILL